MYKERSIRTDVLVVGAGLAGIMAAITAAKEGASVCITSRSGICSGSSFYPGTWGLGMIGPENKADEEDLIRTIIKVGEGMGNPALIKRFVEQIPAATEELLSLGIALKEADQKEQREFIPCFDHKKRAWHGIEKSGNMRVFREQLETLGVHTLPNTTVLRLLRRKGGVCGALAVTDGEGAPLLIFSDAVILATGGMGGLFENHLNTEDVRATGQYLAMLEGAAVSNLEFMQMMFGYVKPCPSTIYNEKMFCYSSFEANGAEVFQGWKKAEKDRVMKERSTHGPFTSRLESRCVDIELFRAERESKNGLGVTYEAVDLDAMPEFIQTYFKWLQKAKQLTIKDKIWIKMFAHASNGGICIDENAFTGVKGLYACGEVTGMMHGADRIGGLSTANALVFGRIAGKCAAHEKECKSSEEGEESCIPVYYMPNASEYRKAVQKINDRHGMILRSEDDSKQALAQLQELQTTYHAQKVEADLSKVSVQQLKETVDLEAALLLSTAFHQAIILRKESRGSHYRVEYPELDEAYGAVITSKFEQGIVKTQFCDRL